MHLMGELALDYATFRRIALAPLGRKIWWYRILGLVVLVLGLVPAADGGSAPGFKPVLVVVGGLLVVLHELLVVLGWRKMVKLAARAWRYEVSDSLIGISTSQTDVRVKWAGISTVRIGRYAWVLKLVNSRSIVIPRAAFSAEAAQQVDTFLAATGRLTGSRAAA